MIQTYGDLEAVSRAAAELFAARAVAAVRDRGRFGVALAGGNTPRRTYALLAQPPLRDTVPWHEVHVFWGDERCVPPDDPRSNYRMAREALLDRVPLPASQVHPMRGVGDPDEAADEYERELRRFFPAPRPRFDLVLLGMGDNAHTASLFPGLPVLEERTRWVAAVYIAELQMHRLTLTAQAINQAASVAFLVAGADKAQPLAQVLHGPRDPLRLPAQLIQPVDGELLWLVDEAAAARL
jgi:6-phosphogluconolactonase